MTDQRELFEAAVVDRLKESGFLEIQIRVEALVRCGEGYQDEVINAGWHYWNAAIAAQPAPLYRFLMEGEVIEATDELIGDNGSTWEPMNSWAVGMEYPSKVFKSVRRLASPAPQTREHGTHG